MLRCPKTFGVSQLGTVDAGVTTHTLPFSEVSEAFRLMKAKEDGVIKPLITF